MGVRAYLLVDVADDMEQQDFITSVRDLEEMPGIDFVDPVIGRNDVVVMVDAPVTVEATASKLRAKKWVKNVEILQVGVTADTQPVLPHQLDISLSERLPQQDEPLKVLA